MPRIRIVFRGLLVLNQHQVNGHNCMEVGILDEPHHHVPRIMTFRNEVREETALLDMNTGPVLWRLVMDDPTATMGIILRQYGTGPIDRMDSSTPDDDFRWIINLENNEFPYGNIEQSYGLDRAELKHVVEITSGVFYTRLKSPLLRRRENSGTPVDFGSIAGVIGLDIKVPSGGAKLIGATPNDVIFEFTSDPNVMYEFSNSPPDTVATAADHFPHYYDIFSTPPGRRYGFVRRPRGGGPNPPGPNPALCGKVFLGEFGGSLVPPPDDGSGTQDNEPGSDDHEDHTHEPHDHHHEEQKPSE